MYSEFFSRFAKNAALSFCLAYLGIAILSLVLSREEEKVASATDQHIELIESEPTEE